MTEARFIVLRGAPDGPAFLARLDRPDGAEIWNEDRAEARRFDARADAEAARAEIVAGLGIATAVVPDRETA